MNIYTNANILKQILLPRKNGFPEKRCLFCGIQKSCGEDGWSTTAPHKFGWCNQISTKTDLLFLGGFGRAILGLAALMLLLYLLVIYEEAKKNTIFQKWLLLDTVAGLWNGHENRPSQILQE